MKQLQREFGLEIPAGIVGTRHNEDEAEAVELVWTEDSQRFPLMVRFLLNAHPAPANAHATRGNNPEPYFTADAEALGEEEFAVSVRAAARALQGEDILALNIAEPPVTVEFRMPQAPWWSNEDTPAHDGSNGHIVILHTAGQAPAWLATEA
jgi:hypothetical protein